MTHRITAIPQCSQVRSAYGAFIKLSPARININQVNGWQFPNWWKLVCLLVYLVMNFLKESCLVASSMIQRNMARILLLSFGVLASSYASSNGGEQVRASIQKAPAAVAVQGDLSKLPSDVIDLKFREFFKMPIGPRGLDASEKLISLAGKRVRIIGYMARQETPSPGFFILAPLPVNLGDEDESLSDDLPASTVFVHVDQPGQPVPSKAVPYYPGLLQLTGTLILGSHEETDGHVSTVRLLLDPELVQALTPKKEDKTVNTQVGKQSSKQALMNVQHAKK